jgi:hypothetical protein
MAGGPSKWYESQDANQNALLNAVLDPRSSDPSSPVAGQLWYRSDLIQWRTWDGANVIVLSNNRAVNNQSATSYTCTVLDDLVTSSGASGAVTFTLPLASTCVGHRITTYNINSTHSLTTTVTGSDHIYSTAFGAATDWFVDPGLGSGTIFVAIASGVWVVEAGYGLDVFWGWVNKQYTTVADAAYTVVEGDWCVVYTSLSAARTVTLPSAASADNKVFFILYDRSGSCSATHSLSIAPNGSDLINGVNAALVAVTTAYGAAIVQGDSTGNWNVIPLGSTVLPGLGVHTVADTAVTVNTTDDVVIFTSLTASRIVTLVAATRTRPLAIIDQSGNASATITISVARAGSDTINKSASNLVVINTPRTSAVLEPDQVSDWMVDPIEVDVVNNQTIAGNKTFSGTTSLAAGSTGVTAAAGDNSTDLATDAFVLSTSEIVATVVATAALSPANTYTAGVLTATGHGTLTIDGHLTAVGDYVLATAEATGSHNGLYIVTTAGAAGAAYVLTRANNSTAAAQLNLGLSVPVGSVGTTYKNTVWTMPPGAYTVGTTTLTFTQAGGPNVAVFTSGSQTWTKPVGAKFVQMFVVSGGGGGGAGACQALAAAASGGAGGAGGTVSQASYPASTLPATLTCIVGVGGSAGASVSASGTVGGNGGNGGSTQVWDGSSVTYCYAAGGSFSYGQGGQLAAGSGGGSIDGNHYGALCNGWGGGGGASAGVGNAGLGPANAGGGSFPGAAVGAAGGGSGGGTSTTTTVFAGSGGGGAGGSFSATGTAITPAGTVGAGQAGGAGLGTPVGQAIGGAGGGGGAANQTAAAGAGGLGGNYGGGGGGGGSSRAGLASGAGGAGAPGIIVIIAW